MKKLILCLITVALFLPFCVQPTQASLVSERSYRNAQNKINNKSIKEIKKFFKQHDYYANQHDIKNLEQFYADNFINNDGFDKKAYIDNVKTTWEGCESISYITEIFSISVEGNFATVYTKEKANGTILEHIEGRPIAGELHAKSEGVYYLEKINNTWKITGEVALVDESSLLYGDARYMNIEILAPQQVSSGETYTASVKIDADDKTFVIGSIEHDLVKYPPVPPSTDLRPLNDNTLERYIKANTDNVNEYAVSSLAISKLSEIPGQKTRIFVSGLACLMKRVNIIPKNKFIKVEGDV